MIKFENLPQYKWELYLKRAEILIERGYVGDTDPLILARKIYENEKIA